MVKKIDVFMPTRNQYGVLTHFTKKFAEAIERQGVRVRVLEAEFEKPKDFLDQILQDPPDCTLSFNGLLPDAQGRFLCDMIQIPHVSCLTFSAPHFVALTKSPFSIIARVDRFDCDFFRGMNFEKVFFMPQAVERDVEVSEDINRIYDVVLLSTLIDYVEIHERWKKEYGIVVSEALVDASELVLKSSDISCVQALVKTIDSFVTGPLPFDPNSLDILSILSQMEQYGNGRNQVELVRSIKNAQVNIYGSTPKTTSWKRFLSENRNVVVHDSVPFTQALEIMKQSKIVLSSNASSKNGGHETVFAALASGALVFARENIYLREFFRDGENIAFYQAGVDDRVSHYLHHEKERKNLASKGRLEVMQSQTWDVRAASLIKQLTPILATYKAVK